MTVTFKFTCKSVSERQAHPHTSETVWDVVLLPNLTVEEDENPDHWDQIAGGQVQLVGLASKVFEVGRNYDITIQELT